MKSLAVKNRILYEHSSLFGFDWLIGRKLIRELEILSEKLSGTLLDVGCGHKPYQKILGKNTKYLGLDLPNSDSSADLFGEATKIPLPDNSIENSFNSRVLDDLPDPAAYFQEINRVLKPGGLAIMVETLSFPEHDAPNDYFRFTRYGLRYLAETNNFTVEKIIPLGGFWNQIGSLLMAFFMRGVSGYIGSWIRVFNPLIGGVFWILDGLIFIDRGTPAYLAVFRKKNR